MKKLLFTSLLVLLTVGFAWSQGGGMMKKKPLPYEFGAVTINNYSHQAGMAPAVFDHWIHRRNFTCRVCHVDVGFGMTENSTKMHAADISRGYYCGTCHNGRMTYEGRKVFAACASEYTREEYGTRCVRCHELEPSSKKIDAFYGFVEKMPRETFGNGINWEKAEEQGLIKPADYIEGVSVKKGQMKVNPDFALKAKVEGMPDIIFSHSKHTVWNGCELCHPSIFVGIKKGITKYTMIELFEGKYCGVCHVKVAFPMTNCQRCHSKPVSG
jgi:c(7)-type cytochrome triheme protein